MNIVILNATDVILPKKEIHLKNAFEVLKALFIAYSAVFYFKISL